MQTQQPPPPPAQTPPPVQTVPPAAPVMDPPPPPPAPDTYAAGGAIPGKWNWIEIGFAIGALTTMFFIIHYYNLKTKQLKKSSTTMAQLKETVEEVKHGMIGLQQQQKGRINVR